MNSFRRIILPAIVLALAIIANLSLGLYFEHGFFTLYLLGVLIVTYFSGTAQGIILVATFVMKVMFFDVKSAFIGEDLWRFLFFLVEAALTIFVIHHLRETAKENLFLRKDQEELLSVVSHDLRNPLNAIRLNAELLSREQKDEGATGKSVKRTETILQICASMNVLINDLIELGRLRRKSALSPTKLETLKILDDVRDLFAPLAEKKKITLEIVDRASAEFFADREKLLRVFSNVVGNAIKFTPENGRISLVARISQEQLLFDVTDTGPGIAPEQLSRVFDQYWQSGHLSRKGLGLGLTISRSIVEAHGGTITVKSALGTGTTFTFSLPLRAM